MNTDKEHAKEVLASKPPYIRILGSSEKGREYLASIRKDCEANIIMRFSARDNPLLLDELKASNVYYLNESEADRSSLAENELKGFPIKS